MLHHANRSNRRYSSTWWGRKARAPPTQYLPVPWGTAVGPQRTHYENQLPKPSVSLHSVSYLVHLAVHLSFTPGLTVLELTAHFILMWTAQTNINTITHADSLHTLHEQNNKNPESTKVNR